MSDLNFSTRAIRGSLLDVAKVVNNPEDIENNIRYVEDGLLVVQDGKILYSGSWENGQQYLSDNVRVHDYRNKLIIPGFIDTHIHYPQMEMVGAYGEQLIEWLNTYTFPTERKYANRHYASEMAGHFVKELLGNGITTSMIFGTVHPQACDALFTEASHYNMRMIAGKVMMDRNAPEDLLDTPQSSYDDSKALIEKWHGNGRMQYAITPRFAPTSTREQLEVAMALRNEFPDCYMQTHLSENRNEVEWVKELFPERKGYLDVYDHYGLTGNKSVFAHCIHLTDDEFRLLGDTGSTISFCPTSNLYLGSGLFKLRQAQRDNVKIGMATDVGAGTTFSMMRTLGEAYKVMQLQQEKLSAFESFYLATLGSAHSLSMDSQIGNLDAGKEADFLVIDPVATQLQQLRWDNSNTLAEKLFMLMTLGDDRNIYHTYVDGRLVYTRS